MTADGRYHTKIESYIKIEKKTGATNENGDYWTIIDKNGTEYHFGANLDSENMLSTSDTSVTPCVWRWSLNQIKDTSNNSIFYSYTEETGAVYLSRIEYNNNRQRAIVFELEERPDPYLTVEQGSEISVTKRLSRIAVSVNNSLVKSFLLTYEPITTETPISLLSSITKLGSDGTPLPPTRFSYKPVVPGTTWLLEKINDDLGGNTTVSYDSSAADPSHQFPPTLNYWLVSSITRDNGLPAVNPQHTTATTNFTYSNGLYTSNEFRGFGQVIETRPDGAKVIHTYHQDDAKKGKEAQTDVTDAMGNPFAGTVNNWSATTANGVYTVNLDRVTQLTYDGTPDNPKQVVTEYEYDEYGNVTLETDYGDAAVTGDENYTRREYAYNSDKWIVDKVVHSTVSLTNGGAKVRESWFAYDGAATSDTPPTAGNLTREEHFLDSGENPVTTYRYDTFGNRTETTDPEGRVTQIEYDGDSHTFPIKVTNAKGQSAVREFNPANGKPILERDPNGAETRYLYDVFQRLVKVIKSGDSDAYPTSEISYSLDGSAPESVTVKARKQAGAAATLDTIQSVDGFGRVIQSKSDYQNSTYKVAVDTFYDNMGRDARHTLPYLTSPTPDYSESVITTPASVTVYDTMGRPVKVTNPNGTFALLRYDHWNVTETDENEHNKLKSFDANGKLVQVAEFNGSESYVTRYSYNPLGELLLTTDHPGNSTSHSYDSLGRKTKVVDPDLGTRKTTYDKAGNVIATTDARGRTTRYLYDALNRVTLVDYPSDPDVTYLYDSGKIGTLSQVTDAVGTTSYTYDARLRKTGESRTMDGRTWTTSWAFDPLDRVTSQTYPDGQITTFSYNGMGRLTGISGILSSITYNPDGQEAQRSYGNNLTTTFDYYPTNLRLKRIFTAGIQDFSYDYDFTGNVTKVVNASQSAATRTETFTYDPLDRLQSAEDSGAGGYKKDYVYNAIGNMLKETTVQNSVTSVAQYTYGQAGAGPHAVTGKTDDKPIIALFSLNNGKPYTTTLNVPLSNVTIGNPTEFMASESAEFTGGTWQTYGPGITFTLSAPVGKKTVYFKVRKNNIESTFKSADIEYQPADADVDGIPDTFDTDSNNNGIPDAWEQFHALPADPAIDTDGDGFSNLKEYQAGTNPRDPYDPYPLNPRFESENYSLRQTRFVSAGEARQSASYTMKDTLGQAVGLLGLADTDGDGIPDILDLDSDNDGMPDLWEIKYILDPHNPADAQTDPDGDGVVNLQEYLNGTNPRLADSDQDGLNDYKEIYVFHTMANSSDPIRSADSDGDGLTDGIDIDPANFNTYGASENHTLRLGNFSEGTAHRDSGSFIIKDRLGNGEAGAKLIVSSGVYLTPERVDFGVYNGIGASVRLTATNAGAGNMSLGNLMTTGANPYEFTISADDCSGISLAAAASCTIDIQFAPSYSGAKSGVLAIPTSDINTPLLTASLAGIAVNMNDNQAPVGSILINSGQVLTNSSAVSLKLNARDASSVVQMCISNDNVCPGWEPYASSKPWTLPAGDGAKTVHVWFRDSLGNANNPSLTASIAVDTMNPTVTPSLRSGLYNTAQLVTLSVSEPVDIFYTLNGSNPTTASPVYSSPLMLNSNMVLKYFAVDGAGNRSDIQSEIYVTDLVPPVVEVFSPLDGSFANASTMTITGRVSDGNPKNFIEINDQIVQLSYNGAFSHTFTLQPGTNIISVVAKDAMDNRSTVVRIVTLAQGGPLITIMSPANNMVTNKNPLPFNGTISESAALDVIINGGSPQSIQNSGTQFTIDVTLVAGANTIEFVATDLAGNRTSVLRYASYLPGKPGDADGNGTISIDEVQSSINMYLGLKAVDTSVDTDSDGVTSIAEVQKVINGYLGL